LINNEDEFYANNAAEEREEEVQKMEEEMRQMKEEVQKMENYEDIHEDLNYYLYTTIVRVIARLQSKVLTMTNTITIMNNNYYE